MDNARTVRITVRILRALSILLILAYTFWVAIGTYHNDDPWPGHPWPEILVALLVVVSVFLYMEHRWASFFAFIFYLCPTIIFLLAPLSALLFPPVGKPVPGAFWSVLATAIGAFCATLCTIYFLEMCKSPIAKQWLKRTYR